MAKNKFAELLGEVGLGSSSTAVPEEEPPPAPKLGKRSDPAYPQNSTNLSSDLYRSVKRELLMDERDFSDLMDELLSGWLSTRTSK